MAQTRFDWVTGAYLEPDTEVILIPDGPTTGTDPYHAEVIFAIIDGTDLSEKSDTCRVERVIGDVSLTATYPRGALGYRWECVERIYVSQRVGGPTSEVLRHDLHSAADIDRSFLWERRTVEGLIAPIIGGMTFDGSCNVVCEGSLWQPNTPTGNSGWSRDPWHSKIDVGVARRLRDEDELVYHVSVKMWENYGVLDLQQPNPQVPEVSVLPRLRVGVRF